MEKSRLFVHKAYSIAGLLLIHYFCLSLIKYVVRFSKTATDSAVWLLRRQLAYASLKAHQLVST